MVITKCIANKLKWVLPLIIEDSQSAFVLRRLITDNALIAFENFHFLKKRKVGRKGFMVLKLDMSKAYDRIKWRFLHRVLQCLCFPSQMTSLIMKCVTSISYYVVVNGIPGPYFSPQWGTRRPFITIFVYYMCKRFYLCSGESLGEEHNSWY